MVRGWPREAMERGGREEITKGKVVEHSVQSSESWLVPLIGPSVAAPSKRELQEPEIIDFVVESRYEGSEGLASSLLFWPAETCPASWHPVEDQAAGCAA